MNGWTGGATVVLLCPWEEGDFPCVNGKVALPYTKVSTHQSQATTVEELRLNIFVECLVYSVVDLLVGGCFMW